MQKIEAQIRDTYYKAYRDALEQQLNEDQFDWVCKLHREIVIRLCQLIPKRKDLHDKIAENMDPVIFKQMLESKTYRPEDFVKLVQYVFGWIKKLCAPVRDAEIDASLNRLFGMMQNRATLGKLVPEFVFSVHKHLDQIDEDLNSDKSKELKSLLKK